MPSFWATVLPLAAAGVFAEGTRGGREGFAQATRMGIRAAMTEPHISLDPRTLSPVEEKLRGPLEDQLTSALKAATDKIASRYAGEPVDEVERMLIDETRAGLHPDIAAGFAPDRAELRRVAEAITSGHHLS